MAQRKGSRSRAAIPHDILTALQQGSIESATLIESLAIRFSTLMQQVYPALGEAAITRMQQGDHLGITQRMALAANLCGQHFHHDTFAILQRHPSDTIRGWAAFALANDTRFSLHEKLIQMRPLADDPHFGVREWAWLALRPAMAQQIIHAIAILQPWSQDPSENIRRFAIESTRPRGVWSVHIPELKQHPELAETLLNAVMCDSSQYVQKSCGNWLNDAAKSNPTWVIQHCKQWQSDHPDHPTVRWIVRHGLRNLPSSR